MKISQIPFNSRKFTALRNIAVALAGLTVLTACASNSFVKRECSPLPFETNSSGSGAILSHRAHETPDRLYVAGHTKPHQTTKPAHVDIQLIAADGRVLAEKLDELTSPKHPRGTHARRHSYVASFPASEARQAVKIRVTYHGENHSS